MQQGLTEEQINFVFAENGKDINTARSLLGEDNKNLKAQLESTQQALKEFEGVNVQELTDKINSLHTQMEQNKQDYENQIKERDFSSLLDKKISALGGKNNTAIKSLLDMNTLRDSKNQDADIDSALQKVQTENDYLFESKEPIKNPVLPNGNKKPENNY